MHIRVTMEKVEDIDYITAANIGLFQMLALIPEPAKWQYYYRWSNFGLW